MSTADLSESIRLELALLEQLMAESADLRQAVRGGRPTPAERLAAATMLQSFYNGVENVLCEILKHVDGDAPADPEARNKILPLLAAPSDKRAAVISARRRENLQQYLNFRESFRYGHFFQLSWEKIAPLAANCSTELMHLEEELIDFLAAIGAEAPIGPTSDDLPPYWTYPRSGRKPTPLAAVYVLGLGMVLLLGLWLGICGHILYVRITSGEDNRLLPAELVQPYIESARLPDIPTIGNTPAQMLPDEKWAFRLSRGKVAGDSLRDFTGQIIGVSYPHPSMTMDIADGRLTSIAIGPQLYRFEDGRLSRYEVNPRRGVEAETYFNEIWQLNRAGQIVHLSTRNDRRWTPKWLPPAAEPLDAGRWDTFWSGSRLVLQMHADAAGLPRTIRVRSGNEFTVFSFGPDGTARITEEPAP